MPPKKKHKEDLVEKLRKLKTLQEHFQECAAETEDNSGLAEELDGGAEPNAAQSAEEDINTPQKELAEKWGLEWPCRYMRSAKGGPVPRQDKWTLGLYEWIQKVASKEFSEPDKAPSLQYPFGWKPKITAV